MTDDDFDLNLANPFDRSLLQLVFDYGATEDSRKHDETLPPDWESVEGLRAVYRLVSTAMQVPGLGPTSVGRVVIQQINGPVYSHRTLIKQVPGWHPVTFDKVQHRGWIRAAEDLQLTMAVLPVTLSRSGFSSVMDRCRDECRSALGQLASVLDERVAQEEVLDDLIVLSADGRPALLVDQTRLVRDFVPTRQVGDAERGVLARVHDLAAGRPGPVTAACRWYLKAAQAGPTPDGVAFLCIAVDALVEPKRGKNRTFNDRDIEEAIRSAGCEPHTLNPTVQELVRLRHAVLHRGEEEPTNLSTGYYAMEWIVRALLRSAVGVAPDEAWPLVVGAPTGRNALASWLTDRLMNTEPRVDIRVHDCPEQ